jgi:hypothetical protein
MNVPDLSVHCISRVESGRVHTVRLPSLIITAQGAKRIIVGRKTYE